MSFNLKGTSLTEHTKDIVAHYEFTQQASGMVLSFDVDVQVPEHRECTATIRFSGCEAATPEEAIAKLAGWCLRAGEALKDYKASKLLPL
jgi:hypothetical protein